MGVLKDSTQTMGMKMDELEILFLVKCVTALFIVVIYCTMTLRN